MDNVKKKQFTAIAISVLAFLVLCGVLLYLADAILTPKYSATNIPDGKLVSEYYDDNEGHSVIFIGDCEVYENFSPVTIWEESGISSWVRGSPQQLIWQSYYLMEETLKYEKPQAFVFNVLSMKYSTPQSESYNRLLFDGMPFSLEKMRAVRVSMTQGEDELSYYIPLLRYHSRWSELTRDDFRYAFSEPENVSVNGFLVNCNTVPLEKFPYIKPLADYDFDAVCWKYLDMMRDLCNENGIKLVLVKAPTISKDCPWYDEWDCQIYDYAEKNGIPYYNFLKIDPADFGNSSSVPVYTHEARDVGIDFSSDTSDSGKHLNVYGAEKLSKVFAAILRDEIGITDDSDKNSHICAVWAEKTARYEQIKAAKEAAL